MKKSLTAFVLLRNYFLKWYLSLFTPLKEKQSFSASLKSIISVFLILFYFSGIGLAQCPNLQIVDLRGTPGFPQTDLLTVCGEPDTLSVLFFVDEPGEIKGLTTTFNFVPGMRYAGFESTHYGGCTDISNADPDVNSPSFVASGITCDDIFVANIGVTADCSVDLSNNDYLIEIEYAYTWFGPNGEIVNCKGVQTLENDFNGAIKVPVLNMFTPSPVDLTVTALQAPTCQTLTISQDGLQSYVDDVNFAICGLELGGNNNVTSITANGVDALAGAVYDPTDLSLTTNFDGSHFLGNTSPNPADERLNTNEKVTVEICYQVENCGDGADLPFTYKAWYGCFDEICQTTSQSSFLKLRPTGSQLPTITANLDQGLTICGADAIVTATVENPNTDTEQNAYTDVSIGFQACGMEALDITTVTINGETVPPLYTIIGNDIDIDLSQNTNPNIGLVDYDGDGFLDDLPGGAAPLMVEVKFNIGCGIGTEPGGSDCPTIACDNVQFYFRGETNCGNNFQGFPLTDGFNLLYGQTDVSNPNEIALNASGSVVGYDFGKFSNAGAPVASGPQQVEVEFCYTFGIENINECPSGPDVKFVSKYAGAQIFIEDFEFVPGSAMFSSDGGATYSMVPDADVTWDLVDDANAELTINAGTPDAQLCYKYSIEVDDCSCGPAQFVAVTQQIVSTCSDCTPDCDIVKGCSNTLFRLDPECSPCPCYAEYFHERSDRVNYGYADKAMTTKLTRDDVPVEDIRRFMPGDTLEHWGHIEVYDDIILTDPAYWTFNWYLYPLGGSFTTADVMPLSMDAGASELQEISIENPDGTTFTVNIADLAGCMESGTSAAYNPYNSNFNKYDWIDYTGDARSCSFKNSHDGFDNNFVNIQLFNYDRIKECNAVNPALGTFNARGEGNCLDDFINTYGIVVGSKINFKFQVPLIKNPFREQAKILGTAPPENPAMRILPTMQFYQIDDIAGAATYCSSLLGNACVNFEPFFGACPGDLYSKTDITLDNCGGTIKHTFALSTFAGSPGDPWFTEEYRPLVEINDLKLPIYSPLAYCANAQVTQNGIITPVTVDATENMNCSPVAGYSDLVCGVDAGSSGFITIDLFEQGITGLGIGLGNCDTICLSYDYCMTCPAPIEGLLDYEMLIDWCYTGHKPGECSIAGMRCTNSTAGTQASSLCDELGLAHNVNYYNALMLDTLYCKVDAPGGTVFLDDSGVTPTAPVSATNNGPNLLASDQTGVSVETQPIEFCNPDPMDATGFGGYVSVPSSVEFVGACADAAGTMPLTTSLVSDDGQTKKYAIDMGIATLASGDCVEIYIKTTLLYCPLPGSLPPTICAGASSGCAPDPIKAALGGGGACASSEVCYAYIFGEAELQSEWFSVPNKIDLCTPFTLHVRVKNVKDLTLLNLEAAFDLPAGLSVIPGSWEVAYPGGAVDMTGNFGAWTGIPDPDVVAGNNYAYSDDALWQTHIDQNGLPGVTSSLDSNNVSFRFDVTTNCDEFLSGSKPSTETMATDPCGPEKLTSGEVASPALIVEGADPADNAQVLTFANPKELFCGGLVNTFSLTALNVSDFPTTDSVVTCITIPTAELEYISGSIMVTTPAGFTPAYITETVVGGDLVVCMHSPAIPVGGSFGITFEAEMKDGASCGDIELGADIKSVVEAVACTPGPPDECAVFVQNSINPSIFLERKAPLETVDLKVYSDCSNGTDPVQVCYELTLANPGPVYTGNVRVGIHDDLTANGTLEDFDAELNGMDHAVTLGSGDTTVLIMCLDVAAIQSCPIIINQTYETDCACDNEATPITNLPPAFIATLDECIVLCPGMPLELETCGDYTIALEPAAGGTITDDGMGMTSIELNAGFGVDTPVKLVVSGTQGECPMMEMRELKSLGDWVPTDLVAEICEDDCVDLDLEIPDNVVGGATITWSPALGLDDPTIATPEVCNLTATQVYDVNISFGEDCSFDIQYTVNYNPKSETTIAGDLEICVGYQTGTLESELGFDTYEWYSLQGGFEILEQVTTTNVWTGPTLPGDYFVKAYSSGVLCPAVSGIHTITIKDCVDLEVSKNIVNVPSPLRRGDVITYEITVCNRMDPNLVFDATNVELTDDLPAGVTPVSTSQTTGSYAAPLWTIPVIENGTCDTLLIDVTIDTYGALENIVEITGSDKEDVDSEEDNDDGDQSEDDEDNAIIELDTFDLALVKQLANPQPMYIEGDTVIYTITVVNQGNVDATNIMVTDSLPCGLLYDAGLNTTEGWSLTTPPGVAMATLPDTLAPAQTATIDIYAIFDAAPFELCMAGGGNPYTNYAWIESATDGDGEEREDIDSTPGSNDGGENSTAPNMPGDNDTDSDGSDGNQDDHDPANLMVFDLALTKQIDTTYNPGSYAFGDTAKFVVQIINQGNIEATNIEVTDYMPAGFQFISGSLNSIWTDNADGSYTTTITDTLAFLETAMACIYVEIVPSTDTDAYVNYSEISASEDDEGNPGFDNDSTADNDPDNDSGGVPGSDDDNNANGMGPNVNEDEDDHDPAFLPIFDLALKKTLATAGPYAYGDTLTFDITVYNQGNVPSTNIEVVDYIACGYIYDPAINPDWTADADPKTIITDTLAANDSTIVSINLILQICEMEDGYKNTAEISASEDDMGNDTTDDDADSNANDDPNDDGPMEDNATDGTSDDEDDSDFATPEIFDLAQIKEIVTPGPYTWGDTLQYAITVVNQGNVPATNIEITDYLPIGLTYDALLNPTWNGAAPTVTTTITDTLQMADTVVVDLYLILTEAQGGAPSFTNISEISKTEDDMGNDTTGDDADSNPDNDPSDDEGGMAGEANDNQFDGNGTDDEDDHDPAMVEIFDLALTKTTMETGPFAYGDTLTFDFNVFNQGTIPATNIDITEFTPCGYKFEPSINPDWALVGGYPTTTITDTLGLQDTMVVSIELIVQPCDDAGAWKNTGEISGATDDEGMVQEDIDSDPDSDPDNDGPMTDNENENGSEDEDDSDFEEIAIFDLAQIKEIITPGPYAWGDTIEYSIVVVNQGNVPAFNIMLTDYIPAGLTYDDALNASWTGAAPAVESLIEGPLGASDTVRVPIFLVLTQTSGGSDDFTNVSEISSADDDQDDTNEPPVDADSDPDNDPSDDEGGEPNGDSDNQFDGDGTDDEDDHDPAIIEVFDLALNKTTTWTEPITYGDIIPFQINVSNQGNITATNIEVTEYIPCGYIYQPSNNPLWAHDAASSTATATINGPLEPGETYTVDIYLAVQPCADDPSTNWDNAAEISGAEDEEGNDMSDADIDSTPDGEEDNDGEVADNDTSNMNGDEDDHDIEMPQIFDLALQKVLADGQVTPVAFGDDVTMTIWVYNQGTIPAANVMIAEYLPAGLTLSANDANGWTDADADGIYDNTVAGPIAIGDSMSVDIVLTVQAAASNDDYVNVAEISGAEDDMGNDMTDKDIDSDTDANPDNDSGGAIGSADDNTTDGNGEDGADEDDSDPAFVPVAYTDLALTKMLAPTQAQAVMPGAFVDFDVNVCNQGSIDAYNVNVIDYIPTGLIYDDSFGDNAITGWSDLDADGNPDVTLTGPIAAFTGCETVTITLQVDPALTAPADLTNVAEITGSEDVDGNPQTDIDSTPDSDPDNETGENDDETDDPADEDDSDPAGIKIFDEPVYDLALAKTIDPSVEFPLFVGDTVLYNIEVINQGSAPVINVEITDNMGSCLEIRPFEPNGWVDSDNDGSYENVIAGPLVPGQRDTVQMEVVITCLPSTPADVTNVAEISAADDENGDPIEDIDSTPDSDPTNDGPSEDNETEDPNDEDDHDPETIPVSVFDLALTKKLAPTTPMPIMPGGDVHFLIEVCNQGNVDAYNIDVVDFPPAGLTLSINDAFGWTDTNADGNYENTIAAIPAGQCKDVKIILTIDPNAMSPLINQAEISDAEDVNGDHPADIDSAPDDNPNNDPTGDNDQEDGDGTNDEDDHDWEEIMLGSWDLALVKTLAAGQSAYIMPGDDVTFTIEIINQGTMDAYNIDIAEYLPADMTLSAADTNGWTDVDADGVLENTLTGPLAADATQTIDLVVTIDPAFAGTSLMNTAEISDFEDGAGNHPTDNDSTPDDDPTNDPFGEDNQEDGDGTDDEDDSDPEEVFISTGPVYDLALEKELDPATVTPVYPGDDVTFFITVTNEGNTVVQNVTIVDYLPADLSLSPLDINGWADADGDGNPENTIAGPMNPGESVMIPIMVTIDPAFAGASLENRAEISGMEDDMGNPVDDFDSDPDNVPGDEEAEDDEDGDIVPISRFDLALNKTVAPGGAPSPIMPGDDVTFRIKVINQGTVAAYNVDIAEHIPSGLTLSTADMNGWVDADADGVFENTIAGPILPGMYEFIDIILTIDPMAVAPASFTNEAEISDAEDENGNHPVDADSMPDSDPDNDATTDNATDNTDGDEDDNDIEEINIFENMFDLALSKIVSPEFIGGAQVGDDIPFDIWIINQGNVAATNVELTEYLPAGTSLSTADTNNWADNDNDGIYETTRPGPLAPGDSMLVEIILTVDTTPNPIDFINESEISGADDGNGNPVTDIDSTPDGDGTNDAGGDPYGDSNDHTGDGGSDADGDGITDEDDHDPEPFPIFDLATKKTTAAVGPFFYGDVITFDYTVYNQGNIPSTNIMVTDYTPCGYEFDASLNPDWSLSGTDATTVITDLVAPGDSIIVSINYIVEECAEITNSAWRNTGEITGSEDDKGNDMSDEDVDSTTDSDPNNDGDMSDNGTDGSNGDEDDSDFELIEIFDLAQKKEIITPGPYAYGDVVTYAITVFNQGNIPATNIGVTDFIPSGLIYDPALNPTWSGAAPLVTTVITDTLWSTGDSAIVYIDLSIAPTPDGAAGYTNIAEINSSEDEEGKDTSNDDADSKPDNDPTDDNGGAIGESSDNQLFGGDDEDDHDPALVEVFDLALNKTTSTPGPYAYGDVMTYDLTVYNQGSVDASNIEISDQLPCGFKFLPSNNSAWDYNSTTSVATTTINSLVVAGDSITVQLLVEIQACGGTASWRNTAEISNATDGEGNPVTDIDSTADSDPTNDGDMEDNATDGSNGDEDDSDFHDIEVFDLAFKKQLAPTQESPVLPGNDVAYQMTIYNQGNVDAFDIRVIDYTPDGLTFNMAANTGASAGNANDWNLVNGVPTYIINTLAPLDSVVINLIFTIDGGFRGTGITNFGEIAHAANTPGGPNTPDADSFADGDMENDNHTGDNDLNGHGNIGGDEDDHDPAFIQLFASEDIVIIGNTDIPTVDTVVTDTITDVDPEATPVFEEEIEEEEVDCSKFPAYCYNGLAIELMPIGMVETWASDISVNDYSRCPDYKLGIWHESMPMKQPTTLAEVKALPTNLVFTCATLGNQDVQLYITDPEGNWNFCETYINVQDNNNGCIETQTTDPTNALLGGQVNTWTGDAVEEVLLSTTEIDFMTTQDGFYHFELPMDEAYTVTPQKNHVPLNGVSTFDLVLMTKHILGVQPFDNPYQWIAADVNNSKTVTAFDLVVLRKMILAIDKEFTNNTSWRFVDADYDFTSDSPLTEIFPEQAHVSQLSGNTIMDFVAVKIGDINGNVRPNAFHQTESRNSNEIFEIQVADQFLKAGETYEIDLQAKDIRKVQGYQFTVNTRDVMIEQIHGALMKKENFGLNNLEAGRITVSWNQIPTYLVSEEKLFTIELQATKDTRLSDVLQLNSQPTIAEAYDLDGQLMDIQLTFTNADNTTEFDLAQNQPNPFRNQTNITYNLPSNSPVELILRDETGRVIRVIKQEGKAGYNLISLDELDTAPGFIYYQLITKFGTKSKKMIRVE